MKPGPGLGRLPRVAAAPPPHAARLRAGAPPPGPRLQLGRRPGGGGGPRLRARPSDGVGDRSAASTIASARITAIACPISTHDLPTIDRSVVAFSPPLEPSALTIKRTLHASGSDWRTLAHASSGRGALSAAIRSASATMFALDGHDPGGSQSKWMGDRASSARAEPVTAHHASTQERGAFQTRARARPALRLTGTAYSSRGTESARFDGCAFSAAPPGGPERR